MVVPPLAPTNGKTRSMVIRATAVGASAILLWALWPAMAVKTGNVPPFELLSVAYASAFLLFAVLRLLRRQTISGLFDAPSAVHAVGLFGILGSNVLYLFALRLVPAATANVVSYLWPVMVVAGGALLGWTRPTVQQWIGLALGFGGAAVVIGPTWAGGTVFVGYALALGSGCAWAIYSLIRTRLPGGPPDVLGASCGFAAPCCLALHLMLEAPGNMSVTEIALVGLIGFEPIGGANALWDFGVSRGNARALAVFAYATPVLAVAILVILGVSSLTASLVLGAGLVVGGAFLGSREEPQLQ